MTATLVASVHAGAGAGGLVAIGADGAYVVDRLATHGIAVSPDGRRFARLTRSAPTDAEPTMLMVVDRFGLETARRVPVLDPHSLAWDGDRLVAVSTGTNSVVWLDHLGSVVDRWSPGGNADCWHLNSLGTIAGRIVVSAFGRFDRPLGWKQVDCLDGHGLVYDIAAAAPVVTGLWAPHEFVVHGDRRFVCNSGAAELLVLDESGERRASIDLGGWVRGLLADGDVVHVGVTPLRSSSERLARITTIDTTTLRIVREVVVPAPNVFALALVPDEVLGGLAINARSASLMAAPEVLLDDPLDAADRQGIVRVVDLAPSGTGDIAVTVEVTNLGGRTWSSVGTRPMFVGVRRRSADGWLDDARIHLPAPLLPGSSVRFSAAMPSAALAESAHELCLVQECVGWSDEVDPAAAAQVKVSGDGGALAFVLVVEAGALEWQTVLFVESLRRWGGPLAEAAVYTASPRPDRAPSSNVLAELARLDVRHLADVRNDDPRGDGTVNRIVAGAYVERHTLHNYIVMVDSETLIIRPPLELLLPAGIDMRARPVDAAGLSLRPDGPCVGDDRRGPAALAGISPESPPLTLTTVGGCRVHANYHGGLMVVRRSRGILRRIESLYFEAVGVGLRTPRNTAGFPTGTGDVPPEVAQILGAADEAPPIAAASVTDRFEELPPTYDVPVHLLGELGQARRAASFACAVHLQYRWLLDPDQGADPIRGAVDSPLTWEQIHWLDEFLRARDLSSAHQMTDRSQH